jgi:hypothetical protein
MIKHDLPVNRIDPRTKRDIHKNITFFAQDSERIVAENGFSSKKVEIYNLMEVPEVRSWR